VHAVTQEQRDFCKRVWTQGGTYEEKVQATSWLDQYIRDRALFESSCTYPTVDGKAVP
jgi:hypothetical protein